MTQSDNRVWDYAVTGGESGSGESGGWGWYAPSQVSPAPRTSPNPRPDIPQGTPISSASAVQRGLGTTTPIRMQSVEGDAWSTAMADPAMKRALLEIFEQGLQHADAAARENVYMTDLVKAANAYQAMPPDQKQAALAEVGSANSTAAGTGSAAPAPGHEYDAFRTAFRAALGRDITQDEQNSNAFVQQLSNELFRLLPHNRQVGFSLNRIMQLSNDDLLPLLRDSGTMPDGTPWKGMSLVAGMPTERFASFGDDVIRNEILPYLDTANPATAANIRQARGISTTGTPPAAGTTAGGTSGGPGEPPKATPVPGSGHAPAVEIPADHIWVQQTGAQQWYYDKIASGMTPDKITLAMLRNDMDSVWKTRAADGTFDKKIYAAAQAYYAKTGWWPTEVELNQFTANLPDVPNLSPADGHTAIPKSAAGAGTGTVEKWKIPQTPAGKDQPLPPGYEWRFSADGTPIPYDTDQTSKDLFSGWYMDPATGAWSYNPMLGAADYLSGGDANWSNLVGGFVQRTGRMPTKDEARALAARLWAGASADARQRAEQFATANGFWPTPFELEYGAAKDTNANTGGGGQGAAGVGQVPVFVPGIGVILVQGQTVGTGGAGPGGGFVFDPFQGIPGQVRPWVREVLNGTMGADQVPPELKDWVNYALAAFKQQLPTRTPDQLPGFGAPGLPSGTGSANGAGPAAGTETGGTTGGTTTGGTGSIDDILGTATFLNAWRQAYPDQPAPTDAQMHDVGFLSQVDPQLTQYLPSGILKQFPGDKLALLPNEVLLQKVDLGTIAALPNERLLGTGQYAGSGFSLSVIAAMPNERLLGLGKYAGSGFSPAFLASLPNERLLGIGQYAGSGFSPEVLAGLPMDASRRKEIDDYLAANPPAGAAPVTTQSISPPAANLSVQTAAAAAPVTAPAPAPAAAPVLAAAGATALAASPTVQALMGKAPTPAPAQAAAPAPPVVATKTTTPPVVAEKTAVETAAAVTSLPQPPASPQAALLASPAVQSLVPKGTSLPVPPPLVSTAAETQRGEGS